MYSTEWKHYLQLDGVSGYVGRDRGEALVGAVYRGGPAATFLWTAGSQADEEEDKNTSQTSSEAHRDCCHLLSRAGTKSLSGNHSGGLTVFDKSFLTPLSSLVNYFSTLEIFSRLLRNIFTARAADCRPATSFTERGWVVTERRQAGAGSFCCLPARHASPARAGTQHWKYFSS